MHEQEREMRTSAARPRVARVSPVKRDESSADPYEAIADLYDLEHGGYEEDLDLYRNVAQSVGNPILELGCGSGRVAIPLAEAGYRVTGLDSSSAMLDRARAAATATATGIADRLQWHLGQMREAASVPGGPFGVVIIALNGLLHLAGQDDQREVLVAARRALDPRGLLVIDLLNVTPETLRSLEGGVLLEGSWARHDGTRVDKFASRRVRPEQQRIETELWYDVLGQDGTPRRVRTAFPQRYLGLGELALMLELAGFAEWHAYGSYDMEPYDEGAERLIVLAEATATR